MEDTNGLTPPLMEEVREGSPRVVLVVGQAAQQAGVAEPTSSKSESNC